jgi:hypothetical protein
MITSQGLKQLGFKLDTDYVLQDDGSGTYIREWNSSEPQPTEAVIETAHGLWQTEWDSQEYARKRKPEYPSIEECVHAILDDDLVALQAKRSAVKAKYPK